MSQQEINLADPISKSERRRSGFYKNTLFKLSKPRRKCATTSGSICRVWEKLSTESREGKKKRHLMEYHQNTGFPKTTYILTIKLGKLPKILVYKHTHTHTHKTF